jgi:hypothetical protein
MDSYFLLPALGYDRNQQIYLYLSHLKSVVSKIAALDKKHSYTAIYLNFGHIGFVGMRDILFSYLDTQLKSKNISSAILTSRFITDSFALDTVLRVEFLPVGLLELDYSVDFNNQLNNPSMGKFSPVNLVIHNNLSDSFDLQILFMLPEDWQEDEEFTELLESLIIEDTETANKVKRIPLVISTDEKKSDLNFLPTSNSEGISLTTALDIFFNEDLEAYTFKYLTPLTYTTQKPDSNPISGKYNYPNESFTLHNLSKSELTREIALLNSTEQALATITYDAEFSVLFLTKKDK